MAWASGSLNTAPLNMRCANHLQAFEPTVNVQIDHGGFNRTFRYQCAMRRIFKGLYRKKLDGSVTAACELRSSLLCCSGASSQSPASQVSTKMRILSFDIPLQAATRCPLPVSCSPPQGLNLSIRPQLDVAARPATLDSLQSRRCIVTSRKHKAHKLPTPTHFDSEY